MQVKEKKSDLAKLETTDMGKPIQEAEWDVVSDSALLTAVSDQVKPLHGHTHQVSERHSIIMCLRVSCICI